MPTKQNKHVDRLHKYLPFSPIMDQVFEEYAESKDSLDLETKASSYLFRLVEQGADMVVLTGDAGHGKTFLCRKLLESYLGYTEEEARSIINLKCSSGEKIEHKNPGSDKALRIYKDFSELTMDNSIAAIENSYQKEPIATIICANEGRLRAVLENQSGGKKCATLLSQFNESFNDGCTSRDSKNHIINLNYQSVASNNTASLIGKCLKDWLSGIRWKVCAQCENNSRCPIFNNQILLNTKQDGKAELRRSKIVNLYATAERLGAVITIREMLMSVAYFITGGLDCKTVHSKCSKEPTGWQHSYAFYNLLFQAPNQNIAEKLKRIPILKEISRLDPGKQSNRSVDERVINVNGEFDSNSIDLWFKLRSKKGFISIHASNGIDEIIGNPRSRDDRQNEAAMIRKVIKSLRRKVYFDDDMTDVEQMKRIGFENGGIFLEILQDELSPSRSSQLKKQLINGLHMIQGLQIDKGTYLYLVDPAFGSRSSNSSIISRKISITSLRLMPIKSKWHKNGKDEKLSMTNAVDWLDREIILRISDASGGFFDFSFDLLLFNFIMQAAKGYVAKDFYAHDIRRITNFIGKTVKQNENENEEISLVLDGQLHSIAIDEGVIQAGG